MNILPARALQAQSDQLSVKPSLAQSVVHDRHAPAGEAPTRDGGSGRGPTDADGTTMSAPAPSTAARVRVALAGIGAAVLGVAPHVLHHVGPLAGAALLAGAGGRLLFGLVGFLAAIPMLRRMRRRTGSWRVPGGVLAVMVAVFAVSSWVLGPAITGGNDAEGTDDPPVTRTSPVEHDEHH